MEIVKNINLSYSDDIIVYEDLQHKYIKIRKKNNEVLVKTLNKDGILIKEVHLKNNRLHNVNGPAFIEGNNKFYYLNGKHLSEQEFKSFKIGYTLKKLNNL